MDLTENFISSKSVEFIEKDDSDRLRYHKENDSRVMKYIEWNIMNLFILIQMPLDCNMNLGIDLTKMNASRIPEVL